MRYVALLGPPSPPSARSLVLETLKVGRIITKMDFILYRTALSKVNDSDVVLKRSIRCSALLGFPLPSSLLETRLPSLMMEPAPSLELEILQVDRSVTEMDFIRRRMSGGGLYTLLEQESKDYLRPGAFTDADMELLGKHFARVRMAHCACSACLFLLLVLSLVRQISNFYGTMKVCIKLHSCRSSHMLSKMSADGLVLGRQGGVRLHVPGITFSVKRSL